MAPYPFGDFGGSLELRLNVPGHGELTIWGNVVRRTGRTGFGIRFFSAFSKGGASDELTEIIGVQGAASPTGPRTDQ